MSTARDHGGDGIGWAVLGQWVVVVEEGGGEVIVVTLLVMSSVLLAACIGCFVGYLLGVVATRRG